MRHAYFASLAVCALALAAISLQAAPPTTGQPVAQTVAATVNGQPIPEVAVQRSLKRVPPDRRSEVRPEVLSFLIDNQLIDDYLIHLPTAIDPKEVNAKLVQITDEIKKEGSTFDKVMQDLALSEAELRGQIAAQLRWDKYASSQATDKALQELFEGNRDMFDGTVVRARHILLTPASGDSKANEAAKARLVAIKQQIDEQVQQAMSKLPPATDAVEREKARGKFVEDAFITFATKESDCPSKAQGGDLGWFPRAGSMVEPFAKAAFALKPHDISGVVTTQFGHHLILVTDRRPGKETKFSDVKDFVREIYVDRLRDSLASQLRLKAKIIINAEPKQ